MSRKMSLAKCKVRRRGTAAVEFAFCAPIVLLLVFGVFEFARMTMVRQAMTNVAREGCRKASLVTTQSTSAAEAVIRTNLSGVVTHPNDPQKVRIQISPTNLSTMASKTPITTTVEISYADISLLPNWVLGETRLRVAATMERE